MKRIAPYVGLVLFAFLAAACGGTGVDSVEVGQDVALTKTDGGLVEGKVASVDATTVRVTAGPRTKSVPKDEIVAVRVVDEAKPADVPAAAKFREYTVTEGTSLSLRLVTALDSGTARVEDGVEATLAQAISVGGAEVLPAGSIVKGNVVAVEDSGRVKGRARIVVHFTSLAAAGRNDRYTIDATYAETAEATKGEDATKIGVGAGAGAAIGAILGGKSGAAKGAAIGGGAGTAVVLSTKGKEVERGVGSRLTVQLRKDIDVRVPIAARD